MLVNLKRSSGGSRISNVVIVNGISPVNSGAFFYYPNCLKLIGAPAFKATEDSAAANGVAI